MNIGKLTNQQLAKSVLSKIKPFRDDVILRPGIGEDCCAIQFGDEICVMSTDPITAATTNIGKLAVHVSCNDIVTSGADPIGILVTIIAPPDTEIAEIEGIISDIVETAGQLEVEVMGGHTEISDAVNRVLLSATVIGKSRGSSLISSSGAVAGDDIVMTKWAGMEGTYIIASDYLDDIAPYLSKQEIEMALSLENKISVVPEGLIARDLNVTSMHDVTEGGILGAVWELVEAAGLGVEIWLDRIPLLHITNKICSMYRINPYKLISSGSMLITTSQAEELIQELAKHKIKGTVIGRVKEKGRYVVGGGKREVLKPPEADEIYKVNAKIKKQI
ncbi:MAG: AIR synthase family protein [Clostridia bacterium]